MQSARIYAFTKAAGVVGTLDIAAYRACTWEDDIAWGGAGGTGKTCVFFARAPCWEDAAYVTAYVHEPRAPDMSSPANIPVHTLRGVANADHLAFFFGRAVQNRRFLRGKGYGAGAECAPLGRVGHGVLRAVWMRRTWGLTHMEASRA